MMYICNPEKCDRTVNFWLIVFFIIHGALFFFIGEGINYHEECWVKYIKYILVLLFIGVNLRNLTQGRLLMTFLLIFSFLSFQFIRYVYTNESPDFRLFLNFYMAISLLLIRPPNLKECYERVFEAAFVFIVAFAFCEYFLLRGNVSNNDFTGVYGYYRVGSCFMSPNTCGGILSLFCCYFLRSLSKNKCFMRNVIGILMAGCLIMMTGSRIALFVYLCAITPIMMFKLRKNKLFYLVLFCIIVIAIVVSSYVTQIEYLPIDRQDAEMSTDWRTNQIFDFVQCLNKDLVFPISEEGHRVDCGWIQLYYDFGLLGFVLFFCIFFYYFLKTKDLYLKLALLMLFVFSSTQVAMYLHPYAYLFFYLISYIEESSGNNANETYRIQNCQDETKVI